MVSDEKPQISGVLDNTFVFYTAAVPFVRDQSATFGMTTTR